MIDWQSRYSQRAALVTDNVLGEVLRQSQNTDIIGFSGGLPAGELFPVDRFREAADVVLRTSGKQALQYSSTEGYSPLRSLVASYLVRFGVPVHESNVLITTGSQQAMDLVGRLFLDPGDRIALESPTYVGAVKAFRIYQPEFRIVENDGDGISIDHLSKVLETDPKLIYVLPNFQNPTGITLSLARREQLVNLANTHDVAVVEDDPYSQLRYEGEFIPPLIALDPSIKNGQVSTLYRGNVVYHGTFSKLLAPGLRVGWVIAPTDVIQHLAALKQTVDLHTSTFAQMLAYEVAKDEFLEQHVLRLRSVYRTRRDVMLKALEEHFPVEATWSKPKGGLFVWVELPSYIDTNIILNEATAKNVSFVPGASFFPNGGGSNFLRLTFSFAKPDRIEEGIKRLGAIIKDHIKDSSQ
ncbi:MAG: PLP-dependent aminotransferase family protein [Chloroflexota bacterium]